MEKLSRKLNTNCCICDTPIYRRAAQLKNKVYCSQKCFGFSCRVVTYCHCGKEILGADNKKNCSRECANKSRAGMKYQGRKPKDKVHNNRALKQRLIEARNILHCELCPYSKVHLLVVHHIIHRADGGGDELENLLLICSNCHAEIHYNDRGLA